jgi:hypothetical protein
MKRLMPVLFAFMSLPAFAGSISGGGMPEPMPQPKEDFGYTCKIKLSQQITKGEKTCYASFVAEKTVRKDPTSVTGSLPIIDMSDLVLKPDYIGEGCVDTPIFDKGNSFVALSVNQKRGNGLNQGPFVTNLHARITSPGSHPMTGAGDSSVRYDEGSIQASGSVWDSDLLLRVSAECVKSVL